MKSRAFFAALAVAAILAAAAPAQDAPELDSSAAASPGRDESSERPSLLILNFASPFDDGATGAVVGYALRAKLRRSQRFALPEELDIEDLDSAGETRPAAADFSAARALAGRFATALLVWGEVVREDGFVVKARGCDLTGDGTVFEIEKAAADERQLALAMRDLADEIALRFTGEGWRVTYESKSTEGWTRVSANLVANGDFEKGGVTPDGWERIDGLCSFWENEEGRGRVVRFDTDVYLSEWQEWRGEFDAGAAASGAPAKTITSGEKYDTVGGTYGVRLYSDMLEVKPGATYSIELDARGVKSSDLAFPKVFVKAYGTEGPAKEYYNMYKACRLEREGEWRHFSRVFSPTARTPDVRYMRVMLFAYWPPGEYAFDNVAIYEVRREAPAAR